MFTKALVALGTLTAASLAIPAAAAAPDPAPTAPAPTQAKPDGKDKSHRVCRTLTPSGSRFTTRVCKTAEEWERDMEWTQQFVDDGTRNGTRRDGEFNTPK